MPPRLSVSQASHAITNELHLRTTLSKHRSTALPLWAAGGSKRGVGHGANKGHGGFEGAGHSRPLADGEDVNPHAPVRVGLVRERRDQVAPGGAPAVAAKGVGLADAPLRPHLGQVDKAAAAGEGVERAESVMSAER